LLRQIDSLGMSDLLSLSVEVTDNAGEFGWSLEQVALKMSDQEGM
jgi:hypothetical protein